jgi:dihydroorotate dehydrogenase electron transfer subunit
VSVDVAGTAGEGGDGMPWLAKGVLGRGSGPVRARCEVVARKRDGAYLSLTLAAPEIAERARPGQFVNVAVDARGSLLRRPFSIYRVSKQGHWAGTVEFVFDAHGIGTGWLGQRASHDTVDVVGPLGSAFPMPRDRMRCLLVGGGYGAAPLFFLAERLQAEGNRVDMIVGAATGERLFNTIEAKRMSATVTFTTDDGSVGVEGIVTDVLDEVLENTGAGVVYGCGPMPMLRALAQHCAAAKVPCQVAVEEHMACGVGVCWTCVVPVRTKDGRVEMQRSCLEGPVFNGARIAWSRSRWAAPPPPDSDEGAEVEEFTPGEVLQHE